MWNETVMALIWVTVTFRWHAVALLFEELCYKPEGREFNPSSRIVALWSTQPLTNHYQESSSAEWWLTIQPTSVKLLSRKFSIPTTIWASKAWHMYSSAFHLTSTHLPGRNLRTTSGTLACLRAECESHLPIRSRTATPPRKRIRYSVRTCNGISPLGTDSIVTRHGLFRHSLRVFSRSWSGLRWTVLGSEKQGPASHFKREQHELTCLIVNNFLCILNSVEYTFIEFLTTDPETRVRYPALPDFLRSRGSGTGSTQPREYNWRATWKEK
jgi:hypothetical protein